ncbi:MAG: small ribosomal subunit Rsm22 family protein [Allorhizobium sp.]
MELPPPLRQEVERLLEHHSLDALSRASARLTTRYRAELRDGSFHIHDDLSAKAYIAARLPATFAAVRGALAMVEAARGNFAPKSLIDFGAGPGTALWAAADCWPELATATMVEASPTIRSVGKQLSKAIANVTCDWRAGDILKDATGLAPADLVTLAYVLDEIEERDIADVVARLWALTLDTIVIVEPGTSAGWRRILLARQLLIDAGAHVIAPCPHASSCPITAPDWCHFAQRVARSRLHRLVKQGEVPYEDEKYIFIAAARTPGLPPQSRILAPPKLSSGMARLKLCRDDGSAAEVVISRRDGEVFRQARRADWGDGLFPPEAPSEDGA